MTPSYMCSTAPNGVPQRCRTWLFGSVQLLIWLIFCPSRWSRYLQHIHPSLGNGRSIAFSQRWVHPFVRLVIEGGILLPLLINLLILLTTGLGFGHASLVATSGNTVAMLVATSGNTVAIQLGVSVSLALLIGLVGGYVVTDLLGEIEGAASGTILAIASSVAINLLAPLLFADSVEFLGSSDSSAQFLILILCSILIGLIIGLAAGLGYSATRGCSVVEWSDSLGLGFGLTLLLGFLVGFVFELVGGAISLDVLHFIEGFAIGMSFGLAFNIGLAVNLWRPLLTYSLFLPWQLLLYVLDKHRLSPLYPYTKRSLIRWHPAFWDELQYLPLWGLDWHLAYVHRCNPLEGAALQQRLKHTYQAWVVRRIGRGLLRL